jgi:asparagine synthase (glutamine-hydrolysing)
MCGIVGALIFDGSDFRIDASYLVRMRDTMVHRGPDGAGYWIAPNGRVGLGHRRLAILDLSEAANQPMCNEDGSLWLSFNGEIYNHADIRRELEARGGHHWRTSHCDTEVILHAYEEWGIDCLDKLRGMFALALWDARQQQLWLVRDRIGIKPLYYSCHHGRITFASEIKALLADPAQPRAVDQEALIHYLSFLATPAPRTLFAGIRKLPGGTYLRVSPRGAMREQRYWHLADHVQKLDGVPEDELPGRILDQLRTSVRLHKASDMPVGVFLSGGIDSSTNVALFSEGSSQRTRTFTIGYAGQYPTCANELTFARQMAGAVGAAYHERLLDESDLLDFVPRMVQLQDEPIADPVCVPLYYVARLARDNGVAVCQLGEGADELFCGYPNWYRAWQLARWNDWPVPTAAKRLTLAWLSAAGKSASRHAEWLRRGIARQPIFWGGAEAFNSVEKQRIASPRLRGLLQDCDSWDVIRPLWQRFRECWPRRSHLDWMSYLDLHLRLPELLLMRVDKMSMGVSLEARVPFLDHSFVELAMSVPEEAKMRRGELKYLLKRAVRGVIPDALIDRPKQGFGVPIQEWFRHRLGRWAWYELDCFCRQTEFFDRDGIIDLFRRKCGPQLWFLLNFALWHKEYIERPLSAARPAAA